jgi:hypothetical protein
MEGWLRLLNFKFIIRETFAIRLGCFGEIFTSDNSVRE